MIQRLRKNQEVPYKTFVTTLLKDESYLDKADKAGIDGYSLVTKSPKMVMLFVEFEEGKYHEINKKIWDMVKFDYKSISEGKNGEKRGKIRQKGKVKKSKEIAESPTV